MKIDNTMHYERIEFEVLPETSRVEIAKPDGNIEVCEPFKYQPIRLEYDVEGFETALPNSEVEYLCRYTPDMCGEYKVIAYCGNEMVEEHSLTVSESDSKGYIEVSKKDSRYFAYTDGTPFFSIGINMAFPTRYLVSNGTEFGLGKGYRYLGMRQYERWIKRCAENGVNIVRVWIGHDYFSPDTLNTYEFDYVQFSKIDKLVELARKYNIRLKLTIEQFRNFELDDNNRRFDFFFKELYDNGVRCESSKEWLTDEKWGNAWMAKVKELAKRYSGDTTIFAIELWNEMNCVGHCFEDIVEWNKKYLPKVKELFPKNLVVNSLGSLDCEVVKEWYDTFCWEYSDFNQVHRYLDQGALFEDCNIDPIDVVLGGIEKARRENKPIFVAETGAVDRCHSSHFKYLSSDDRGIFFADTVYTPIFAESCSCGNIWFWDFRYIESKNFYKMYTPIVELTKDIDFTGENFKSIDMSNEKARMLILKGNTMALGYIRNRTDNWHNTLRDLNSPTEIEETEIKIDGIKKLTPVSIWDDETATLELSGEKLIVKNLMYGVMFKAEL